jgi:CMP-N,N'-diacetyllegionaminic acid synthase
MNKLCTICARGGSKGVPNKNSKILVGKPLIAYSIEQAKQTNAFEHIVVSTDSDEIGEIAKKYGAEVFFKRPSELASDTAAKLPVIKHAFTTSEEYYKTKFDILVDLDATSPLRSVEDILNCIELIEEGKHSIVLTAMPARRNPYFNLVEQDKDGRIHLSKKLDSSIVRRQDAPQCFDMNASIYVWTREALLTRDGFFYEDTGLYVMPEERSIDIDSSLDFEFVEFLLEKRAKEC